ncbi:TMV resistance protein N-like [Prosopis cineraria]|uniref:TMV resistance protein N-like n=1 Tax=Prosopis cineraria TaxID=364024 RepID=UPI00241088C0|nr:TMV resistance protein N-like [Prosopis cineraria]
MQPGDQSPAMAYYVQGESSSNSDSSTPKWKYGVFLSFAGKDTRLNFTHHLYAALTWNDVITFRDDEAIERGEDISQELLQAIEDYSLVAIVILSENYANSTWYFKNGHYNRDGRRMIER